MRAVVFDAIGEPLDVLRFGEAPRPEIGPGEILVRMTSASINPGDFLYIQNLYPEPKKPVFPNQIAGGHGAGIVVDAGAEAGLEPGTKVGFSFESIWAEYAAIPAKWAIPLPDDFAPEKAAQLANLITAWDLVRDSQVGPGDWLVLTAGHSTVAVMTLQLAARRGVRVVSVVRRIQPHLDLKALGAEHVLELASLQGGIAERLAEITGGAGVHGVVDCVGGPLMGELIRSLNLFGQAVCYGGLSTEPFELHNFDILLNAVTLRPYSYRYFFDPPPAADAEELREIIAATAGPDFVVPVGGFHPLEEFGLAVEETVKRPELGKRFFAIEEEDQR